MKRCTRCTLSEYAPRISFDSDGVCSYCSSTKPLTFKGEAELLKVLDRHRRKDGKPECIVSLSGGRDSTYTMLKLVKDYGMKVLAVNYENPFTDPVAAANVENATRILGVELVKFKQPGNLHEKTFKNGLLTWLKRPVPGMIPMMCVACKLMYKEVMRVAKQRGIRCIVAGNNALELTSFKNALVDLPPDADGSQHFSANSLRPILKEVLKNPGYLRSWKTMLVGFLYGSPEAPGSRFFGRQLDRVDLFSYIPWDEKEVISRITAELGWDYPRELKSTWRFDCTAAYIKDLVYMTNLRMTEKDDFYARMVREGMLTREQAFERLREENYVKLEKIHEALKIGGIEDVHCLDWLIESAEAARREMAADT